jgi:hypothetical protein
MSLLMVSCKPEVSQETKPVAEEQAVMEPAHKLDADPHQMMGGADPHQMGLTPPKSSKQVVVPEAVKNKSYPLSLKITDKSTGNVASYEVKPDSEFNLPDTNLKLVVGAFLPDFTMDAESYTSVSAEPNNPALQVIIQENGVEKYSGWLFSKFADMHAFEHERYSIILEDKFEGGNLTGEI